MSPPTAGLRPPQHRDRTPVVLGLCARPRPAHREPQDTLGNGRTNITLLKRGRRVGGGGLPLPQAPPQATAAQTAQDVILTRARVGGPPSAKSLLCTWLGLEDTGKGPSILGKGRAGETKGTAQKPGRVTAPLEAIV